jgi:hypothetical protein
MTPRQTLSLLLSCCLHSYLLAQSYDSQVVYQDTSKYDFVIVDAKYQNQFAFWGRNFDQRLPFIAGNLMYYFHTGFWVGASNFLFFHESIPAQFGLTLGYYKDFSEKVEWHVSYSQFYIPDSQIPTSSKTQGYFQTTMGFDWGLLFSTLQAHALLNKNPDVFFTTHHSRYFVFNKKLWNTIQVSFEPKFSFTMGTHNFDYADGIVIGPGGGAVVSNQQGTENEATTIQPLNWDFTFPIKFEAGRFALEWSWKYTTPLNTASTDKSNPLHVFILGANYFIPIKR